jgi:predicted DNA-binding ribbon-helix-helix protein
MTRNHLLNARQRLTQCRSAIVKRSVVIAGHKTSVTLEDAFWAGLKQIARSRNMTLSDIVRHIDGSRGRGNLSSSIRLFVLEDARAQCRASAEGAPAPADKPERRDFS